MKTRSITGTTKRAYLELLVAQWGGLEESPPATVSVVFRASALKAAEKAAGGPIPPEVLLLFSEEDVFGIYDLELEQLATRRAEADEAGVPAGLVPLGREGDEWVCFTRERAAQPIALYAAGESATANVVSVAAWLDQVRETHLPASEPTEDEEAHIDRWVEKTSLEVQIEPDPPRAADLYRVTHPKFGEGGVRREEGSGADRKLEIDFGTGGVRNVLARFVQRIPG